jgi:hypothetical protein
MAINTRAAQAAENIVNEGKTRDLSSPDMTRAYGNSADKNPVIDHLSLSEQDRKDLGIRDDEVVTYPARDEEPGWRGKRRFQAIRRKYGEARQVLYIGGPMKGQDPCAHIGNMMVAVPRDAWDRIEQERIERGNAHIRKFRPVAENSDEYEMEVDIFEKTVENYRAKRRSNAAMFRQMKIGEGGTTSKMTLEEGLEYYERRGVNLDEMEARVRRGGEHSETNAERWHSILRGDGGKKTIVSGFGKAVNPGSALGQVQQRNAREASGKR